jgi:hypothetical protein
VRRLVNLCLLICIAVLIAACGDEPGTSPTEQSEGTMGVEELRPKAAEVTDQLAAGEFSTVHGQFDDNMSSKLAEDGLANAWQSVVATKGFFKSRGEPKQIATPAGQEIFAFDTPIEFEQGPMKTRLAFHADGRIAGLFILNPEVP